RQAQHSHRPAINHDRAETRPLQRSGPLGHEFHKINPYPTRRTHQSRKRFPASRQRHPHFPDKTRSRTSPVRTRVFGKAEWRTQRESRHRGAGCCKSRELRRPPRLDPKGFRRPPRLPRLQRRRRPGEVAFDTADQGHRYERVGSVVCDQFHRGVLRGQAPHAPPARSAERRQDNHQHRLCGSAFRRWRRGAGLLFHEQAGFDSFHGDIGGRSCRARGGGGYVAPGLCAYPRCIGTHATIIARE
ncbi:10199_t:CDS:2, partial [Scutellospora calospora]